MPILLQALNDAGLQAQCTSKPASYARLCPRLGEVVSALKGWYGGDNPLKGGAERTWFNGVPKPWWRQDKGWKFDNAGQALWDSWWNVGQDLVFHRWFNSTPQDYPGPSGDSMENGVDPFFVHALLGRQGARQLGTLAPRIDYLSASGTFPSTQAAFQKDVVSWAAQSMNDTLGWLANPGAKPAYVRSGLPDAVCCQTSAIAGWREDMITAGDMNCFSPFGVYNAPCMPAEDKGTYAQVVEVFRAGGSPRRSSSPL
jgi:hypothetical protein